MFKVDLMLHQVDVAYILLSFQNHFGMLVDNLLNFFQDGW